MTGLNEILRTKGVSHLIVCGVTTEAPDGLLKGHRVAMASESDILEISIFDWPNVLFSLERSLSCDYCWYTVHPVLS